MKCALSALVALAVLASTVPGRPPPWVQLIGEGMEGWKEPTGDWMNVGEAVKDPQNEKLIVAKPGKGILVNGKTGRTRNLFTKLAHGDCSLHIEFMVPKGSNSGIYLMGRYEIQILDSWGKKDDEVTHGDCGGIYQRWDDKRKPQGYEGHAPRVNASKAPGEWQTLDVSFKAPRFDKNGKKTANAIFLKVVLNGKLIHQDVEVTGPTRAAGFRDEKPLGPIMIQGDHGPVAYRNLRILHQAMGD